ncbi:MAG: hypothetical protein J2P28_26375 [Actinobacteria bacterium]|nr:hypothetical protein [Actinomycetota bacterium]
MSLRLVWTDQALHDLEAAVGRSGEYARAGRAVVENMERFAELGWTVGRLVRLPTGPARYLPVRPLGVFYQVRTGELVVLQVVDARGLSILP